MNRSSLARRTAAVAVCVGATAAVGVSPAFAKVAGINMYGSGSSLQKVAQTGSTQSAFAGLASIWHANPSTDQPTLNNDPTSTYTSTNSGGGLAEFGNVTGALDPTQDSTANAAGVLDAFIGTDDPPTGGSGGNLNQANVASGTDEETVPVFQAPVAIILSLPAGLTIGPKGLVKIRTAVLQEIYDPSGTPGVDNVPLTTQPASGSTPTITYPQGSWGALLLQTGLKYETTTATNVQFNDTGSPTTNGETQCGGTGGFQCINLEVRNGTSGTTYATHGFLYLAGDPNYPLSSVSDAESWPLTVDDGSGDSYGANSGSSTLVKNTLADPGSIGYVNLADAVLDEATGSAPVTNSFFIATSYPGSTWSSTSTFSEGTLNGGTGAATPAHQIVYAEVQDNDGAAAKSITYTYPGIANYSDAPLITVTANLYTGTAIDQTGSYTLDQGSSAGVGDWDVQSTPWGESFGGSIAGDPSIVQDGGGAHYGIVAATYDAGWEQYDTSLLNAAGAYNGNGLEEGATASSYLAYLAKSSGGQSALAGADVGYAKLPTPIDTEAEAQAALVDSVQ